jgi:NAD(P)-dependent dehydrogenase (short-subunit alcohol dehydrogenase family)
MPEVASNPPFALVTGAARRLGRAIALGLSRRGYAIGLHYHRSQAEAANTAAEIQACGVPVKLFQADLLNPDEIRRMFDCVGQEPYPLKVLVNSAAVFKHGSLRDLSPASWDESMAVNLRAPWLCAQQAARLMEGTGGVIINISDSGARKNWTGLPAYVISKNGLEVLTRLLARTFSPGIRVNAVAPGLIMPPEDLPEADWLRLVNRLPAQKAGDPANIVDAVLFLIDNKDITGQIIVVDGGYQLI